MSIQASKTLIVAALLVLPSASSVAADTFDVAMPQISAAVSPFLGLNATKDPRRPVGLMLAQMNQISISGPSIWIVEPLSTATVATATQSTDLRVETAEGNLLRLLQSGSGNVALQTQNGRRSYTFVSQTGQNNHAETFQAGSFQVADITQSGSRNQAAIFQTGEYASASIQQTGFGNTALIRQ